MEASTPQQLGPVLVANRGEIALRIGRSAQGLGLSVVAIFTDPDRGAPHARRADLALRVPSYLDIDAILQAAARSGARSVHPGYGFLSENPAFAAGVEAAGRGWIGPPPAAIELMGDKARSKRLARDAGVPVLPGTTSDDASAEEIAALAAEHGFPLVIKALAGGGGRGMRVVGAGAELESSLAAARREAESAFGDGRVLAERYLERPRHLEIQILADTHGNVIHLGERECSLQRRHQKVVEEAPSPLLDQRLRERMQEAAVELARACDYVGAGTVEFIVTGDGEFFFLEMNTRLQVEHPVTELVWGVDLVEQQIRVAAGERLDLFEQPPKPAGHAVEARIYAEDPAAGFLPAVGTVRRWRAPVGPGVRVDDAIEEGRAVGTDYDPMLAKVIAHGPDRATAIGRLDRALADLELLGVASNAAFARRLLALPEVRAGRLDTGLLERTLAELELGPPEDLWAAAAAALFLADTAGPGIAPGPWRRRLQGRGEWRIEAGELRSEGDSWSFDARSPSEGELLVELDGIARAYVVAVGDGGESVWVGRGGHQLEARVERRLRADSEGAAGSLQAPMPGKVLAVEVSDGERVQSGDVLVVLESMKMELQITAPIAGLVEGLSVEVGDRVAQGQALAAVVDEADGEVSR